MNKISPNVMAFPPLGENSSDGRTKRSTPIGGEVHGKPPTTVRGADRTEVERIAAGVAPGPSEANSGATRSRGEPVQLSPQAPQALQIFPSPNV